MKFNLFKYNYMYNDISSINKQCWSRINNTALSKNKENNKSTNKWMRSRIKHTNSPVKLITHSK